MCLISIGVDLVEQKRAKDVKGNIARVMYHILCHPRRWGTIRCFCHCTTKYSKQGEGTPMRNQLVVKNVSQAMRLVKEMNVISEEDWSSEYREIGRNAMGNFLRDRMKESIADYLGRLPEGVSDRKNGSYPRHVLTEIGDILLFIPRTRAYNPVGIIEAYSRRSKEVDRLILACFLLGLSTRKVGAALLTILGEKVSPTTVSRVAKTLDAEVASFHRREYSNIYKTLIFDGVVLSRKTGMGA